MLLLDVGWKIALFSLDDQTFLTLYKWNSIGFYKLTEVEMAPAHRKCWMLASNWAENMKITKTGDTSFIWTVIIWKGCSCSSQCTVESKFWQSLRTLFLPGQEEGTYGQRALNCLCWGNTLSLKYHQSQWTCQHGGPSEDIRCLHTGNTFPVKTRAEWGVKNELNLWWSDESSPITE